MWFSIDDLQIKPPIFLENLHGYVLPHAGTKFTGRIISHTLRFRPAKTMRKIVIFYYPASTNPDIWFEDNTYYHEYYVPWQCLLAILGNDYIYEGCQIGKDDLPAIDLKKTLLVVSADFSHFLPMQTAIEKENRAAQALMFKELYREYAPIVDDLRTFKTVFAHIPEAWQLQWVGRDRSAGAKAVGYLSFLLCETPSTPKRKVPIDGLFVTVYAKDMTARECQGQWFDSPDEKWSLQIETNLIKKVIALGETTSRLTGGLNREVPLTHYSITYLYKDLKNPFIRGWHGVRQKAFYLPEVFLENTFLNGHWLTARDTTWPQKSEVFDMTETIEHLNAKAGIRSGGIRSDGIRRAKRSISSMRGKSIKIKAGSLPYTLYSARVAHFII